MRTNQFPKGWDEKRIRRVLRHYETQTDAESAAEDEKALEGKTVIQVPQELLPVIHELIRLYQAHGKSNV